MRLQDDPARTADHGYFPWERVSAPKITKETLADAIETGIEPKGAPFNEWIHLLFEGCCIDYSIATTRIAFKAMLNDDQTYREAMGRLCDIAFEKYGADYE